MNNKLRDLYLKVQAERLQDCLFGFRLCAGMEVQNTRRNDKRTGIIQWIGKSGIASVCYENKHVAYCFYSYKELKRTGNFGRSALFPAELVRSIYDMLPLEKKLYFWYTKGKSVGEIATKFSLTPDAVKKRIKKVYRSELNAIESESRFDDESQSGNNRNDKNRLARTRLDQNSNRMEVRSERTIHKHKPTAAERKQFATYTDKVRARKKKQ